MKWFTLLFSFLLLILSACTEPEIERTVIATESAPEAIGPYSQGILVGNTLYAAGQIGLDPKTGTLASDDLEGQAVQTLENLKAVIEAAGMELSDVVDVDVYITNMEHYPLFNEIYAGYFSEGQPARAVVGVSELPLGALVEVKAVAISANR
jgi:2-iminobutanoate/2-iminopropanoate deaminase